MSMTELMSMADLSLWPQLAMVIFVGVFALVIRRLWTRQSVEESSVAGRLPLEDGVISQTSSRSVS